MDIYNYFNTAKTQDYNEALIQNYIMDISIQHNYGAMKEWKWKINRKVANILIKIENTSAILGITLPFFLPKPLHFSLLLR